MSNPGIYVPIDCANNWVKACGPVPPMASFPWLAMAIAAAVMFTGILLFLLAENTWVWADVPGTLGLILGFIALIIIFFGWVVMAAVTSGDQAETATRAHHTAYIENVRTWLRDDYGITVNTTATAQLAKHDVVAIKYHGSPTAIRLITDATGGLSVEQTTGQIIPPSH